MTRLRMSGPIWAIQVLEKELEQLQREFDRYDPRKDGASRGVFMQEKKAGVRWAIETLRRQFDPTTAGEREIQTSDFLAVLGGATFWEHDYGTGRHIIHVNLSKLKKLLEERSQ